MTQKTATHRYDDIIWRERPALRNHPRMPVSERAAQFAPFAALTGYDEAVKEKARHTDRRRGLSEEEKDVLDAKLRIVYAMKGTNAVFGFVYFVPDGKKEGGTYMQCSGRVKKADPGLSYILLEDGTRIDLMQIDGIESAVFEEFGTD